MAARKSQRDKAETRSAEARALAGANAAPWPPLPLTNGRRRAGCSECATHGSGHWRLHRLVCIYCGTGLERDGRPLRAGTRGLTQRERACCDSPVCQRRYDLMLEDIRFGTARARAAGEVIIVADPLC